MLTTICDTDIFPWHIFRHVDNKMVEVDDDNHGPARSGDIDDDEEENEGTAIT